MKQIVLSCLFIACTYCTVYAQLKSGSWLLDQNLISTQQQHESSGRDNQSLVWNIDVGYALNSRWLVGSSLLLSRSSAKLANDNEFKSKSYAVELFTRFYPLQRSSVYLSPILRMKRSVHGVESDDFKPQWQDIRLFGAVGYQWWLGQHVALESELRLGIFDFQSISVVKFDDYSLNTKLRFFLNTDSEQTTANTNLAERFLRKGRWQILASQLQMVGAYGGERFAFRFRPAVQYFLSNRWHVTATPQISVERFNLDSDLSEDRGSQFFSRGLTLGTGYFIPVAGSFYAEPHLSLEGYGSRYDGVNQLFDSNNSTFFSEDFNIETQRFQLTTGARLHWFFNRSRILGGVTYTYYNLKEESTIFSMTAMEINLTNDLSRQLLNAFVGYEFYLTPELSLRATYRFGNVGVHNFWRFEEEAGREQRLALQFGYLF